MTGPVVSRRWSEKYQRDLIFVQPARAGAQTRLIFNTEEAEELRRELGVVLREVER